MRLCLVLLLVLSGCSWVFVDEEQKNYSKNEDTSWVALNYPQNCEWLGFGRVVDGDTIIVFDENGQIRVRMIGIDTPESKKEGTPVQAYALDASRELKNLIGDPLQVCLLQDGVGDQYDIYDRRLSYVFTEAGIDLNATMLQKGWARAYLRFPFERKNEFATLEMTAKAEKVGRWE